MKQKYWALRSISGLLTVAGVILIIVGALCLAAVGITIAQLNSRDPVYYIGALVGCIVGGLSVALGVCIIAYGQMIQLLMDIESNTRISAIVSEAGSEAVRLLDS